MNSLFIDELSFEKVSYARISENPAEWTKDIIETFFNQFPYFAQSPIEVKWRQRDDSKGYALGAIEIKEGIGMTIPVLVKARELYPFDLAIVQGAVMPLTNATIQMYIQSKGAFLKAVPKETGDITYSVFNPSLSQDITPNFTGAHSYLQKSSAILDKIAGTIEQADKDKFFEPFVDDKLVTAYKSAGTSEVIVKIAKANATTPDEAKLIHDDLERDIHYIYKSAAFEYTGIFGSSKVYDPFVMKMDAVMAKKFDAVAAMPETEITKTASISTAIPYNVENSDRRIVVLEDKSYIELPTDNTLSHIKFAEIPDTLSTDEIRKGVTGFFKLGNAVVTRPFAVDLVYTEKSRKHIEGFDGLAKVAYCEMKGIDAPYTENGIIYIPVDMPFVKLGKQITLDINDYASANEVACLTDNTFDIRGAEFSLYKKAFAIPNELNKDEVVWNAIQCGCTSNDITKIATLKPGEVFAINHDLHVPISIEKLASVINQEYSAYANKIKSMASPLIKYAYGIPNVPTIDAVLSLNFANKNNLNDFIESIPVLESAVHYIAKLLLQTRMGISIVDEGALRKVMLGLVDILQYLQGVSTIVSKQSR